MGNSRGLRSFVAIMSACFAVMGGGLLIGGGIEVDRMIDIVGGLMFLCAAFAGAHTARWVRSVSAEVATACSLAGVGSRLLANLLVLDDAQGVIEWAIWTFRFTTTILLFALLWHAWLQVVIPRVRIYEHYRRPHARQ